MSIKSIVTGLVGIVFVLVFLGCSKTTDFYIQNLTQSKKHIKINYNYIITSDVNRDSYGDFSFNYKNGIVMPKVFKADKNVKPLENIKIDSTSITLIVEPQSTVRISKTYNYLWQWNISTIEIDDKSYDINELKNGAEKVKDDYVYQIKESF